MAGHSTKLKVKLALSREGFLFGFFILGLGCAAIYSGQSGLVLLFCCILAICALFWSAAMYNIRHLQVCRRFSEEIFAGRDAHIEILVKNTGTLSAYGLHIYEICEDQSQIGPCFISRIAPGETACTAYVCCFPNRGVALFPAVEVRSRFPMPFMELRCRFENQDSAVIFPHPLPTMECVSFKSIATHLPVLSQARRTLDSIREIDCGRKRGRILWKLSARRGKLLEMLTVKSQTAADIPTIILKPRRTLEVDRFEQQVSEITHYALSQIRAGQIGEIQIGDQHIIYSSAPHERRAMLEILAKC